MAYLRINMEKYDIDQEIMRKYENLRIVRSQNLKYLFIYDHILKYSIYWYLDSTGLISGEKVFSPIRLFELFGLNFDER